MTTTVSELPYFIFPNSNLKVLIDTGSTKSFVKPDIADKFFNEFIKLDPFKIVTAHGSSIQNYSTLVDCSNLFHTKLKPFKFYLFDFHNHFDCLLGLDNLKAAHASINVDKNLLETPNAKIPILYHNVQGLSNTNNIMLEPRSEKIVEINVKNMENGVAVIPHIKGNDLEIPECITKVQNSKAICSIINSSGKQRVINLPKPVTVQNFFDFETMPKNTPNLNNFNVQKCKFDISKIRTSHMNSEEKEAITKLVSDYSDIFHIEGNKLTFTNKVKHTIKTMDEIPVYTKTYRYPEIHRQEVRTQIQNMLDQNIIRPSNSPWSSPIWIVPKKLDASMKRKWRIVIDYRKLNEKTIGDRYPLPNINDLLDKLGRCQYFSTLDLASGFHQIEMAEEDIPKTAFNTDNGHYEFLRMPFGLRNSPATFQRCMDNILRGIQNEICLVYLDDIIIFSTSLQEHIHRLRQVFDRLRQYQFKIQLDKSEFLRKEVAYLGHIVTPQGVKPNPDKIKSIQNFPIPKNTKQIKGFLGLLGYYRKFIKDFAKITKPLTKCLKKDATINVHDPDYVKCFEFCKTLLVNDPILQYPNFSEPFVLTTDASNIALGAVLSQGKIGSDLPVAYASRTLNETEQNYSTIEKETLAIVWAVKYFRPYLFGKRFTIVTDHRPLQWLFSLKEPNSKLVRWRLKLEEYDYQIVYKKGSLNKNADALSRVELNANETNTSDQFSLAKYVENFNKTLDPTYNDDKQSIIAEPGDAISKTSDDSENDDDVTVHTNEENPILNIPILDTPVNYGRNQIIISNVHFNPCEPQIIKLFQNRQRIIVQFSENNFEKDVIKFVKEYVVSKVKYHLYFKKPIYEKFANVLQTYFKNSQINMVKCNQLLQDVTDEDEITTTIQLYHEGKTNHRGIDETEKAIRKQYFWPNQRKSIQNYINQCELCQLTKYDRRPLKLEMNVTPTAVRPFQILHVDSISLENTKFLTIVDSFSKYAQAYRLNSAQGIEVVNNLVKYFTHHCIPEQIISDNGGEFKNSLVRELLETHKIKIHFISSQHSESNGIIERFHSTLIEHIRLLNNQKLYKTEPIEIKVNYALLAYNNSIHSVTNLKPYEIITGHLDTCSPFNIEIEQQLINNYISEHKNKIQLLYQKINEDIKAKKQTTADKINANREKIPDVPEKVFVKNKQKQGKTNNKYNLENVVSVDKDLKTAKIDARHKNTTDKIHLSNIKRPRKPTNTNDCIDAIAGPSRSDPERK